MNHPERFKVPTPLEAAPAAAQFQGVTKQYGRVTALDDMTLEIERGEIFGLLGPNGAGKTTTLQVLLGLTRPERGRVRVFGREPDRDAATVRALTGVVMQQTALDIFLTGRENVLLQAALYNLPRSRRAERTGEVLAWAGLTEAADRLVSTYSGGMKRRLDLAIGVLHEPRLLILDEPTLGLDIQTRSLLWQLIRDMKAAGTTVILTTHYLEEANQLCDRVGILKEGRVVALGTPAQLRARSVGDLHRLQVRFKGVPKLPSLPSEITGRLDGATLHLSGPERALWETLARLVGTQAASLSEVTFAQPTLNDVFLRLTADGVSLPPSKPDVSVLQRGAA